MGRKDQLDRFVWECGLYGLDGRYQVAIAAQNDGRIIGVGHGLPKKLDGNIDVGLFFFESGKRTFAVIAILVLALELPIDRFNAVQLNGPDVGLMLQTPFGRPWIVSREIQDFDQFLAGRQNKEEQSLWRFSHLYFLKTFTPVMAW